MQPAPQHHCLAADLFYDYGDHDMVAVPLPTDALQQHNVVPFSVNTIHKKHGTVVILFPIALGISTDDHGI
jgi:hypothetical protein